MNGWIAEELRGAGSSHAARAAPVDSIGGYPCRIYNPAAYTAPRVPGFTVVSEARLRIGPYEVESIIAGTFGLDGGAMFGIVPRVLWQRTNPPDERNRIALAARCLLIRGNDRCILVETGIGDKFDDKRADIFSVGYPRGSLAEQLAARGLGPGAVTDVILTHLHFDHCGGTTHRVGEELALSFPDATHHVQRRQWEWAQAPSSKDAGSFRPEDFAPLAATNRLHLLEGDGELFEGIHTHTVEGHTPGMQLVSVRSDGVGLLFCADLVPTRAHLRWPYIMAYDNQPLVTLEEKLGRLPAAAERGDTVVFGHDPECDAAILRRDQDAVMIAREVDLQGFGAPRGLGREGPGATG